LLIRIPYLIEQIGLDHDHREPADIVPVQDAFSDVTARAWPMDRLGFAVSEELPIRGIGNASGLGVCQGPTWRVVFSGSHSSSSSSRILRIEHERRKKIAFDEVFVDILRSPLPE
jgi:hypothetical protein